MAEQFSIPTPGDIIAGKYLIQEELGRGSYGVVFRARQLGVERDVALKTLLPQAFLQADIVERFQREAALISRLQHPNIVTLYDFGESDGVLYMAMEFIRGQQLNQRIRDEAPMVPERAVHIARQVLLALNVAHTKSIVHRDLKPENIILCSREGDDDFVKVLDFGIAKMTESDEQLGALKTLTVQGYVLGTPHYMSPEAITGESIDNRADLYAVGMLLYEMLSGKHPYDAPNPSAVLMKHLSEPIPTLEDPALQKSRIGHAITHALAKEPEDRVASAQDFIDILDGRQQAPTQARSINKVWLALGAVVVLLALAAATLAFQWSRSEPAQPAKADKARVEATKPTNEPVFPVKPSPTVLPTRERAAVMVTGALQAARSAAGFAAQHAKDNPPATTPTGNNGAPPAGEPPSAVVAPKQTTLLRFTSVPSGAQVVLNGRPIGATPCQANVQGEEPVKVLVKKIGFRPRGFTVRPKGGAQSVPVKLKPGRLR